VKREQLTDWRQSRLLIGQPLAGLGLESDKALKSLVGRLRSLDCPTSRLNGIAPQSPRKAGRAVRGLWT